MSKAPKAHISLREKAKIITMTHRALNDLGLGTFQNYSLPTIILIH